MNMINKGIPYFPTPANFFDEEVMELLEAKFGVLASYIVMRLLCKIYKASAEGRRKNFNHKSLCPLPQVPFGRAHKLSEHFLGLRVVVTDLTVRQAVKH